MRIPHTPTASDQLDPHILRRGRRGRALLLIAFAVTAVVVLGTVDSRLSASLDEQEAAFVAQLVEYQRTEDRDVEGDLLRATYGVDTFPLPYRYIDRGPDGIELGVELSAMWRSACLRTVLPDPPDDPSDVVVDRQEGPCDAVP